MGGFIMTGGKMGKQLPSPPAGVTALAWAGCAGAHRRRALPAVTVHLSDLGGWLPGGGEAWVSCGPDLGLPSPANLNKVVFSTKHVTVFFPL